MRAIAQLVEHWIVILNYINYSFSC